MALPLAAGSLVVAAPAAQAAGEDDNTRLAAAAELLNKQVRQFDEPTQAKLQWNYDFLLALAAAGDGASPAQAGQAWRLLDSLKLRAAIDPSNPALSQFTLSGKPVAAVTSFDDITEVLHVVSVYGQDPTNFAGRDLVAALETFEFPGQNGQSAVDPTWYTSSLTYPSRTGTIAQARAVLALAAAEQSPAAAAAAGSLRAKQLAATSAWPATYTGTSASFEATVNVVTALTAEGSVDSVAAAQTGAAYLIGLQQEAGTFTGGTTVQLVAQAANALRGIAAASSDQAFQDSANAAVEKAAAWLRGLQVIDGVDPLYQGAFATNAADVTKLQDGSFAPLGFSYASYPNTGLVGNTYKGILGLSRPISSLALTEPAGDRPAAEGPYYSYTDGACTNPSGVTAVVDYGTVSDATGVPIIATRCVTGLQASAWAALVNAGFHLGADASRAAVTYGGPGDSICEVDGVGGSCALDGPKASWSLWTAAAGSTTWKAASVNPSSWAPAAGTVVGLRLSDTGVAAVPPRAVPSNVEDTSAPIITFTKGPQGAVTGDTTQAFTWTLDDPGTATACRLDSGPWVACDPRTESATRQSYTWKDISYGDHVFAVRATDLSGNFATAQRNFSLAKDTTVPVVAIMRNPGRLTSATSATFTMSIDDSSAKVKCRIDSDDPEEWLNCSPPVEGSPATSRTYSGLEIGRHRFEYKATDPYGNAATAGFEWEIAPAAPPVVQITTAQNTYTKTNTTVSVGYVVAADASETIVDVQCRLDGGDWATCATKPSQVNSTATTKIATTYADGTHTVQIKATTQDADQQVKQSEPAEYTWTVDTGLPEVTVVPPADGPRNHGEIAWTTVDASPIKSYRCVLDTVTTNNCTSPFEVSGLAVGEHTLTVTATDSASNASAGAVATWQVTPSDRATVAAPIAGSIALASFAITGQVVAGNLDATVEAELWQNGDVIGSQVQAVPAGTARSLTYRFANLKSSSTYQVRLVATDENGVGAASGPLAVQTLVKPATVGVPQVSALTTSSAKLGVAVEAGDLDASAAAELLLAGRVAKTAPVQRVGSGKSATLSFSLTGLAADTGYQVRVAVTRANGEAVRSVAVPLVTPAPPAKLTTRASASSVLAGKPVTVTATGLKPREAYQIDLSGTVLARGVASATGTVSHKVTIPAASKQAKAVLRVVGKQKDRAGQASIWVASKKAKLSVKASARSIKKNKTQKISIAGLVPGEKLTIKIKGLKTRTAKASSSGKYTYKVKVGKQKGTKTVTVYGQVTTRVGKTSYKVK